MICPKYRKEMLDGDFGSFRLNAAINKAGALAARIV
jgi:hypothetical protein